MTLHNSTLRVVFVLLFCLIFLPLQIFTQSKIVLHPSYVQIGTNQQSNRPKVGLVLSGGGGRGLAQIGVLRALERNHIPIDLIVGNSLGSVIGGLYASGYSITEIESIATHTSWSDLLSFSEEPQRTDLFVGQKQAYPEGFLSIRFEGLEPIIPSSISGGQRLSNFFSYLTLQALYHPNPSFDDLKIPFRATATDLISGKRIILDHGSLAEAMRASITVPLLYSPLERDSMFMVDGGLTSNIPADVARSLGCDVVIVVNSTSSMRNVNQMGAPWEVADQIMTIMMQESNKQQLKLADVIIAPISGDRIASDFSGVDTLIVAGEKATEQSVQQILDIIRDRSNNLISNSEVSYQQALVKFKGDSVSSVLQQKILAEAQTLTQQQIVKYLNEIYATGKYANVYAEITGASSPVEIVFCSKAYATISDIQVSGNDLIPNSLIESRTNTGREKVLTNDCQRQIQESILKIYREHGYSLARIESVKVNQTNCVIHFKINEGKISQIKYEGNEKTRDYIIRREFPLDVGNVFNIDQASQGIVNIRSTGLFDYVLLDVQYENNQPIIILRVKEKSSELLRLGFHADNERGIVSTVDARDANFRGAWEDFGLVMRYGYRDRFIRTEYTVNRIFHSYFTLGLRGYYKSRDVLVYDYDPSVTGEKWDRIEKGKYTEIKYGGSLMFGSHFQRLGDVTAELRWEKHKISPDTGTEYRFVGLKLQSIIDTEDKFYFPTKGIYLSMTYELATRTLGSQVSFGKVGITYENYLTFLPRHTLRPRIMFGFADETLPIAEQFSLGGQNSFFGLREDDNRGRQLFLVSMEYRFWFPFKLIFETYIKVRYDLGTISTIPKELKLSSFHHGIGAEISLDTPIGPASFGIGKSFYLREGLPNSPVTVGPLLLYFSVGTTL